MTIDTVTLNDLNVTTLSDADFILVGDTDTNTIKKLGVAALQSRQGTPSFNPSMFASAVNHGYAANDQGIKSPQTTDGWWVFTDLKSVSGRPPDAVGELIVFKNEVHEQNPAMKHVFAMAIGRDKDQKNKVWFMYRSGSQWTPWFSEQGADQATIDSITASVNELKSGNADALKEIGALQTAAGNLYAPTKEAFNKAVTALINAALANYTPVKPSQGDDSFTLSVKDAAGTDTIGVDTLVFESSIVEPDNLDSKEIRVKPFMEFTSTSVSEEPQTNSVKANTVSVSYPLEVYAGANAELDAVVALAHGSLEMGHAPAYLAYAHSEVAIVGKEGLSGHHDGAVWFTDTVYPSNAFMSVDKPAKTISIQEADTLDPNVTGGTDYLVAFRIHMQGTAPDDGTVRIYLWDTIKKAYLKDVNGEPMGSQRLYKQGEELGYISVIGVVNAKGTTTFTTHVMDDFVDDELIISSRTEGASGILIQALTSDEKTSPALLQFEQDTGQQIDFDSKYYGSNLITLNWMLQEGSPEFTAPAGSIKGLNDGSLVYAIGQTKMSVADKTLSLVTADFNLGKFINPDDTHLLKGKTIKVYTTMANPDGDIVMAMFKWTGAAGKATTKIYGSRNQGGGIVPVAGWELEEEDVIVANALGDFKEYSHNFTVPDDANELAIILYPSLGLTTDSIHIKGFNADVLNPFMGYIVKAPELYTEQHLKSDPEYAKLVQDRQGYASLRYTLNKVPTSGVPMPVGMIKAGKANITIDDSVNIVVGSAARGGEGAIKFGDEGRIVVKTELYIYPGESLPKGNKATARFWYASVSDDGQTFTKIDDSETSFLVTGGDLPSKCKMNAFGMDVKTGDRIVLFSLTDATDDAYISSNFTSTMLTTEINFEEIIAQGYDAPDLVSAPMAQQFVDLLDTTSEIKASVINGKIVLSIKK